MVVTKKWCSSSMVYDDGGVIIILMSNDDVVNKYRRFLIQPSPLLSKMIYYRKKGCNSKFIITIKNGIVYHVMVVCMYHYNVSYIIDQNYY